MQEVHKQIYDLEERYRRLKFLLRNKKRENQAKPEEEKKEPTDYDKSEEELKEEIKQIEAHRIEEEKRYKKLIADLDAKNAKLRLQVEEDEVRVRAKEQEKRIKEMRERELKRQS